MAAWLEFTGILAFGAVLLGVIALWAERRNGTIRNVFGFLYAIGSSYSVGFVVDMWVQQAIGSVPAANLVAPTVTWSYVAIILLYFATSVRPSLFVVPIPFFLNAMLASTAALHDVHYAAVVVVLSFFGAAILAWPFLRPTLIVMTWRPSEHSNEDNLRWCWLRAVEWGRWPIFLSQPIAPVLLLWFTWTYVVPGTIVLNVVWALFMRYRFVSVAAADAGALFVLLKWISWPVSAALLFMWHRQPEAWIAALWPALIFFLGVFPTTRIGRIQIMFMRALGYELTEQNP